MAQLESGKIYIVDNVGIKNYTNEPSYHTVPEYFTWLSNKIATGLGIEIQPIIKDSKNCCLPLPYINDPTENRLCLCLRGITLSATLSFKIGYFNGNDYHIGNGSELPDIMYSNQSMSIKYKNSSTYTYYPYNSGVLLPSETGSFVIDTRFLESNGFYTMAFLTKTTNEIDEAAVSPRVFICDMVDVLTEKHYDGLFTLPNTTGFATYEGGYVPSSSGYQSLGAPSIAAIGVDKDGKYSLQGYFPQIFASDYSSAGTRTQETLISASMIRVQFGRLRTAYDIYLTIGNSTENLMDCCDVKNIKDNHIDWNENVLKINNKKYSLSCNCERDLFSNAKPQWVVVIENKEEIISSSCLEFSSNSNFTLSATKLWNGTIEYSIDKKKTWKEWDGSLLSGNISQSIYLRGINNTIIMGSSSSGGGWSFTGKTIKGNIETLLDYKKVQKDKHPSMDDYCFYYMFNSCTNLEQAPELGALKVTKYCYASMFKDCSSLKEVPELPATKLATRCYDDMFVGCTSLTKIDIILPAVKMEPSCYHSMFWGCNSIETVSKDLLPSTELAYECYRSMFYKCTSLKNVPKLPATILAEGCYRYMYFGCSSLVEINKLPAIKLIQYCYNDMYYGCKKIRISRTKTEDYQNSYRIPNSGTGTSATNALLYMIYDTGGASRAIDINITYYTSNKVI